MRIPRWLFIPAIIIGILYWSQPLWFGNSEPNLFDVPKSLDKEKYTLDFFPVSHVNNVAVWSTSMGADHNDYLYLTPADELPVDYRAQLDSGYIVRASGSFYRGTAIPVEYLNVKPKPERLRVFEFETVEMIKPPKIN